MRHLLFTMAFISINVIAQDKYLTKTGVVNFEASVASFEEVKASHNAATAILNTANGDFAALVLVKGFRFKNALMEEHFNENYAESDVFPKATFRGKISGFSKEKLNPTETEFTIDGDLIFHGTTKTIKETPLTIVKDNGIITITGEFIALASDFNIDIPKIVSNKIAEEISVNFQFQLKKK